jgi:hypothetical protein
VRRSIEPSRYFNNVDVRHNLSQQFDTLLSTIRRLDGFDRFLLGPSEVELKALSEQGPIVIFNVSDIRSDAILINQEGIRCLPLYSLKYAHLQGQLIRFLNVVSILNQKVYSAAKQQLAEILEWLWDCSWAGAGRTWI